MEYHVIQCCNTWVSMVWMTYCLDVHRFTVYKNKQNTERNKKHHKVVESIIVAVGIGYFSICSSVVRPMCPNMNSQCNPLCIWMMYTIVNTLVDDRVMKNNTVYDFFISMTSVYWSSGWVWFLDVPLVIIIIIWFIIMPNIYLTSKVPSKIYTQYRYV